MPAVRTIRAIRYPSIHKRFSAVHKFVLFAGIAVLTLAAGYAGWSFRDGLSTSSAPATVAVSARGAATHTPRYMLNVILHTPEEIGALLSRAEELARARPPAETDVGIALVLHGPEVEFFARHRYARYKTLVDRAQRLNAAHIIEIKICRTEMKSRGLKAADIPEFIELVPYGPDEIARLQRRGYIYL